MPTGPGGRAVRLWRQIRPWRERPHISVLSLTVIYYVIVLRAGVTVPADVPWYLHPLLIPIVFVLPLAAIARFAKVTARIVAGRRAQSLMLTGPTAPRPRLGRRRIARTELPLTGLAHAGSGAEPGVERDDGAERRCQGAAV